MSGGLGHAAKLTLGPVLFYWEPEIWRDFYFRIADEAEVDTVCIGEVVCPLRQPVYDGVRESVVERLRGAGKEVMLSTPALIADEEDLDRLHDLCASGDALIEANDMAACALLAGRPHAVGPYVNVYNEGTLAFLARKGARRACLPVELRRDALSALAIEEGVELEVQAFGRVPLALSARCYAARARGLTRENCHYVCREDRRGLEVETLDGEPFLAVSGPQTLSGACLTLLAELDPLKQLGIGRFRLWPMDVDMVGVARVFREALDGRIDPEEADNRMGRLVSDLLFANGFYHGEAGAAFI